MGIHLELRSSVASKVAIAIVAVALALGPLAQKAAAAPVVHESFATAVAGTFKTDCPVGAVRCTDTQLLLFVTDGAAQACLDIYTYNPAVGLLSWETGCAIPTSFAFDTKNLTAASFSTTIAMQLYVCNAGPCVVSGTPRSTAVSGRFTGVGDVATFRGNSKSTFANCTMFNVGKGSSRQADASVTIDGWPLDPPGFLSYSTQKSKVICR